MAEPSVLVQVFNQLLIDTQLNVLSKLFSVYASTKINLFVPDDCIILAAKAMVQLESSNQSNVIYNLAKTIGTIREDKSDSRLSTKQMPMGLIEYIANLFAADTVQSVKLCMRIA